jgi:cyclic pyranopterin phosphate synthase
MPISLTVLRDTDRAGSGALAPPPSAPRGVRASGRLVDSHGRVIRDLRLSITDRCNFRCVYCMEPDVRFMEQQDLLGPAELERVARVCVGMGVEKVRITGGEPTVHPRLTEIIGRVASIGGGVEIALTTNGSLMDEPRLRKWKEAGLDRVTVSIDSVDPARFAAMTRSRTTPADVIEGARAAMRAGLSPVKLNAVIVRGFNEDEIVGLAGLARDLGVEMRFIEYMPLDSGHGWDRQKVVTAAEIVERIGDVYPLLLMGRDDPHSTSLSYEFADGAPGRLGTIAPVSRPFCGACSRLRVTADGKVRPCLFGDEEWDLRPLLRGGADDDEIARFLVDATWTKRAGHGISSSEFVQPRRPMSAIGG